MILIVEDHSDTRTVLVRLLKFEGYDVAALTTGHDALDFLKTSLPQLLILDYGLPDIDGLDVFLQLRNTPRTAHIPVIIFSAYEGARKEKALLAGVDAYIVKSQLDWIRLKTEIRRLAGPPLNAPTLPTTTPPQKEDQA